MVGKIPERWLAYSPVGRRVAGTPFIPFKTPLSTQLNQKLEEKCQWNTDMVLGKIPSLGMIIDLTYNVHYYNENIFKKKGIEYQKNSIIGREIPRANVCKRFTSMVKHFLHRNKYDKLIGVHCTHGVNRTGYMIVYYMITEMNMNADSAIARFSAARGYNIERLYYLRALRNIKIHVNSSLRDNLYYLKKKKSKQSPAKITY